MVRQRTVQPGADEQKIATRGPNEFPDIKTIRDAIPAHCFEGEVLHSMAYVVRDIALAGTFGWAALTYIPQLSGGDIVSDWTVRTVAWIIYGYVQGLICTGIWILAHECGHGAFSRHRVLNDVVGWVLHSALLVPYFSWKFSHHRHHRFTGHMEKDMAFVPQTTERRDEKNKPENWSTIGKLLFSHETAELFEDTPIVQAAKLVFHQVAGFQTYLLFNVSAGKDSKQREEPGWLRVSHFEPTSAVFRPGEGIFIALSDLGLGLVVYALHLASKTELFGGWGTVWLVYLIPYMWVHHWLVAITYLHHNHPDVHHYDAEGWTFVKGALATVDRDFGWVGRHLFHGIIDTHVVHHLFPRIPFYKAEEATEAIKPLLGPLYHQEKRSFMSQLWSTWTSCKYVEQDPHVPGAMRWAN